MKPAPFEYHAPEAVEEVVSLLGTYGDDAKILGGGQSLIPMMALRLATPPVVIDINRVGALDYLRDDGQTLGMGALTRHRAIELLPGLPDRCPLLSEGIELVGHIAIRNRGTILGSLAHADPAAELPALALALDGEIDVIGPMGQRTIPASDFFVSLFTTALRPDEVATEARLRLPDGRVGSAFLELSRRHGDFAVVGIGAVVGLANDGDHIDNVRIVAIGVGETAMRIVDAESVLLGEIPSDELFREAAQVAAKAIHPPADIHGPSDYRRSIAEVLTRRVIARSSARAKGDPVDD